MSSGENKSVELDKNFLELCYACRIGDVENADILISSGANVNGVDEFDNSPLFLASLCGHEDVVNLLLRRGAVCDRDRYEGARCIYGALTDSIRNILLKFDISKAVDVKQPFASHLSSLLNEESLSIASFDFVFIFDGEEYIHAHKFMLVARSAYFKKKFEGPWAHLTRKVMPEGSNVEAFKLILKFIYLVPILHELKPKHLKAVRQLGKKLCLSDFLKYLDMVDHVSDPSEKATLMTEFQYKFNTDSRTQLEAFVHEKIFSNRVEVGGLTDHKIRLLLGQSDNKSFGDTILIVPTADGREFAYLCHKAILIRSTLFKTMFSSLFLEAEAELPIVALPGPVSCEVAEVVLSYLYYDSTDIPWEITLDVLSVSDYLLTDRLKTMAAVTITQSEEFLKKYSVFDVLHAAWSCSIERLEHHAAKVIAYDMERYIDDDLLKSAIIESSQRIKSRQDTDTIELVDDIRFYLLQKHDLQPDILELLDSEEDIDFLEKSGLLEYKRDIEIFDSLLQGLGFDV